jgi:hypothetical protein
LSRLVVTATCAAKWKTCCTPATASATALLVAHVGAHEFQQVAVLLAQPLQVLLDARARQVVEDAHAPPGARAGGARGWSR